MSKFVYEDVVFAQGEDARDALGVLADKGQEAAIDYLSQWHYPGEHMTRKEPSAGSADSTYETDNYILTWNHGLEYIGLEYKLLDE